VQKKKWENKCKTGKLLYGPGRGKGKGIGEKKFLIMCIKYELMLINVRTLKGKRGKDYESHGIIKEKEKKKKKKKKKRKKKKKEKKKKKKKNPGGKNIPTFLS